MKRMYSAWLALPLSAAMAFSVGCGSSDSSSSSASNTSDTTSTSDTSGGDATGSDSASSDATGTKANNIPEVATAAGTFKTLLAAAQAAGLVDTLEGKGPLTVFAPTDDAFAKLPAGTVDTLLKPENKAQLVKILTYHVLAAKVLAADVKAGDVTTVEGDKFTIGINGSMVTITDGTGHVANVIKTDVMADNGVIHVIDSVLMPPAPKANNIPEVATAAGTFTTLLAAVQAAGLVDALEGKGPFTVFAPNDDAFKKLPAGTVDTLLKPENKDKLTKILTYHVLAAKVLAADVKAGEVATLQGDKITIAINGSMVTLTDTSGNTVNVIKTDVMADNGVIHVIDGVLLPK